MKICIKLEQNYKKNSDRHSSQHKVNYLHNLSSKTGKVKVAFKNSILRDVSLENRFASCEFRKIQVHRNQVYFMKISNPPCENKSYSICVCWNIVNNIERYHFTVKKLFSMFFFVTLFNLLSYTFVFFALISIQNIGPCR